MNNLSIALRETLVSHSFKILSNIITLGNILFVREFHIKYAYRYIHIFLSVYKEQILCIHRMIKFTYKIL